jgi:hypothetical protein
MVQKSKLKPGYLLISRLDLVFKELQMQDNRRIVDFILDNRLMYLILIKCYYKDRIIISSHSFSCSVVS